MTDMISERTQVVVAEFYARIQAALAELPPGWMLAVSPATPASYPPMPTTEPKMTIAWEMMPIGPSDERPHIPAGWTVYGPLPTPGEAQ